MLGHRPLRGVGVSVGTSPTEELLATGLLIGPCGLKKSVKWTCVPGCTNGVVWNNRFPAVGLARSCHSGIGALPGG